MRAEPLYTNKELSCDVCPISEKCPLKDGNTDKCEAMINIIMKLQKRRKMKPKKFSIEGLHDWIERLEAELVMLPRVSERYMDVVKTLKDCYIELHKLTIGTKSTHIVKESKVDINKLVEQAEQAEKELTDEEGNKLAIIKKVKNG